MRPPAWHMTGTDAAECSSAGTWVRSHVFNIAASTLGFLSGIWLYRRLGGLFPLPVLTQADLPCAPPC